VDIGWGAFDMRRAADDPDGGATRAAEGWHPLWVRSVAEAPADPWLHGAVVAFWSDYGLNGAARRTHEEMMGETSSVSASHSVWIHRRSRARDWHYLDVATRSLSGNQGYVTGTLHDPSGSLVASFSQGVFIRRPQP
jgi:acyl-CoA thioesterase-2